MKNAWGFSAQVLDSDYRNMEEELPLLFDGAREEGVSLLLVNGYHLSCGEASRLLLGSNYAPVREELISLCE